MRKYLVANSGCDLLQETHGHFQICTAGEGGRTDKSEPLQEKGDKCRHIESGLTLRSYLKSDAQAFKELCVAATRTEFAVTHLF